MELRVVEPVCSGKGLRVPIGDALLASVGRYDASFARPWPRRGALSRFLGLLERSGLLMSGGGRLAGAKFYIVLLQPNPTYWKEKSSYQQSALARMHFTSPARMVLFLTFSTVNVTAILIFVAPLFLAFSQVLLWQAFQYTQSMKRATFISSCRPFKEIHLSREML